MVSRSRQTSEQVEDTAQLFLGLRIQCARCHHHPFEKWSQDDYYGFSAFFSRLGHKPLADASNSKLREKRLFNSEGIAEAANPRTGKMLRPTALGGKPLSIPPDHDPHASWRTGWRGPTIRSLPGPW